MEGIVFTIVVCAALVLLCVFAIFSYVKRLKSGCCGTGEGTVKRVRPEDKELSHYPYMYRAEIDGMHCENCATRVENAFNSQGMYAVVDLHQNSAMIHAKQALTEEEIRQIIQRAGYGVICVATAHNV